jgi:hypothetical protein
MATWYWNGATDTLWATTTNWWSSVNGTGSNPPEAPWSSNATRNDTLSQCTVIVNTLGEIDSNIVAGGTGVLTLDVSAAASPIFCDCETRTIQGGTFNVPYLYFESLNASGVVSGITFTGNGTIEFFSANTNACTFSGTCSVGIFNSLSGFIVDHYGCAYGASTGLSFYSQQPDAFLRVISATVNTSTLSVGASYTTATQLFDGCTFTAPFDVGGVCFKDCTFTASAISEQTSGDFTETYGLNGNNITLIAPVKRAINGSSFLGIF